MRLPIHAGMKFVKWAPVKLQHIPCNMLNCLFCFLVTIETIRHGFIYVIHILQGYFTGPETIVSDTASQVTLKYICKTLPQQNMQSAKRMYNLWDILYMKQGLRYNDVIMSATASQITGVSIYLLNCLFRQRSKKTPKLRITGLCVENSPASNAENVSIWWRHHEIFPSKYTSEWKPNRGHLTIME